MPYDFNRLNDEYPVRDILEHRLRVRIKGSSFACPVCGESNPSGSIFHDPRTGREKARCHSKCDKAYDSIDLAKFGAGSDDVAVAVEWLTGQAPPNGHARPNGHAKRDKPKPHDYGYFPPDQRALFKPGLKTPEIVNDKGRRIYPVTPALVHLYSDGHGIRLIALRYVRENGEKSFFPVRWSPTRGLVSTSWQGDEEKLFYRHTDLADWPDKDVLVVEGEKCVDYLRGHSEFTDNYVVISWQGGSGSAKYQPWELLKARRILFWPDADVPPANDEYGKSERAMRGAAKLAGASSMQIVVPLADWTERLNAKGKSLGFDAADLLAEPGMTAAAARALMESLAEPLEPEEEEKPKSPPPPPPPEGEGPELPWVWKDTEQRGHHIHPTAESNVVTWINELPPESGGYRGLLARDIFTQNVLFSGQPMPQGLGVRKIVREIAMRRVLDNLTHDKVEPIIGDVADANPVNPLADELRALKWDGTPRYLLEYAGVPVPAGSWARVAGWRWLLGLVRRILDPGCQHDGVLVLEGLQGARKTSFFRTCGHILGRDLFVEVEKLTREPDTLMILQGKAVVELSEMGAARRDHNAVKSMLSSRSDKYRVPYGRAPKDVKRTCVFGGTTNDRKYLRDPTGNRRYWIVRVAGPMSLDALAVDLPQLLAQAVHYLTTPDPAHPSDSWNYLTEEEEKMQEAVAKERLIDWPQFDKLDYVLDEALRSNDNRIEPWRIWEGLGYKSVPPSQSDLAAQLTILMEERGWENGQWHRSGPAGPDKHTRRSWRKPDVTDP